MIKTEENNTRNVIKPIAHQGMDKRKLGPNRPNSRRALSVVNENVVESHGYLGAVNKSGLARKNNPENTLHQVSRPVTRKDAFRVDNVLHQASRPVTRKDAVRADNVLNQASRPLRRKDAVCVENVLHVASRPVTRRLAAQMESIQQARGEECKKLKPTVPTSNGSGESIFVDAEESKAPLDHPVPMSLEQSNDSDQMEEREIMDTEDNQAIIDIEGSDLKNPLLVADYVKDLYAYYKKMEINSCVSPNYMAQQHDLNEKMRAILIDWLIEVHYKFELMDETLFLTVNIIDRFLSKHTVIRKKLQLVGLVALLIACKYEEVSVPVVNDLIIISDKAYTRQEVLEMERLMLNELEFKVFFPTPYVFMRRFLKAAQSDTQLELLSFFLIELCLVEYGMLKYPPSLLAAAAVYTAHCTLHGFRKWTKICEWHSSYSEDGLLECSRLMVGFHQKAAGGKLTGVHRKYCTSKFCYVAKQEPARFLIETQL